MRRSASLALSLAMAACGDNMPRTEVVVTVDAERALDGRVAELEVSVEGGADPDGLSGGRDSTQTFDGELPRVFGLVPTEGDARRHFRMSVVARDGVGDVMARASVAGRFVEGATKWVHLRLEQACADPCPDGRVCCSGRCDDLVQDLSERPKYVEDEEPPLNAFVCRSAAVSRTEDGGGGVEAGVEAGADSGRGVTDAGADAATDGGGESSDAGLDAGVEAGTDSGVDAGMDAAVEAGTDSGVDAAVEAGTDSGVDAAVDAGPDSGVDAGTDASTDAGLDAGADSGFDASTDAGVDAGAGEHLVGIVAGGYQSGAFNNESRAHTCAYYSTGRTFCWGNNAAGQLGVGSATSELSTAQEVTLLGNRTVGADLGQRFSCWLLDGAPGAVYCSGANLYGQLGVMGGDSAIPVQTHAGGVLDVAAGSFHACAVIDGTGTVQCWGDNSDGQLGRGTTGGSTAVPAAVPAFSGAARVALGTNFSCALMADQTVQCWGANTAGQLGDGTNAGRASPGVPVTGLSGVTDVSGGGIFACAIAGGRVWCWGSNAQGQLGEGSMDPSSTPVETLLPAGVSAIRISCGNVHACALLDTGQVMCWGERAGGRIGNGNDTGNQTTPAVVPTVTGATYLGLGWAHSCAGGPDAAWCWGRNEAGQLGNGNFDVQSTPIVVMDLP